MRPTLARLIAIVPRSAVPKHLQDRVIPPPLRPSEKPAEPTLVDLLIARKDARNRVYADAQQNLQETGALEVEASIQPWPTNLRVEPIVKREAFAKITKEARMALKEALKER
ncbi:hypothetical protein ACEPAI_5030 [Sanghuangporus weigelae]